MPLLDGLDEMSASQRASCVRAINAFIDASAQHLDGLVVTCRLAEYCETQERLAVGIAVRLHDLATSSVADYLKRYANHADKQRLLMDEELSDLLRTPLILNLIASLDAQAVAAMTGAAGRPDRLAQLWDAHIKRMVTRSGKRRLPMDHADFLATLQSLALAMSRQNQTIFQLDDLQPSALRGAPSLALYFLGSRMGGAAVIGAGVILSVGLTPLDMGISRTWPLVPPSASHGAHRDYSWGFAGNAAMFRRRCPSRARIAVAGLGIVTGLVNLRCGWAAFFAAILASIRVFRCSLLSPHRDVGQAHADIRPVIRFSLRRATSALPYAVVAGLLAAAFSFREAEPHAIVASSFYALAMCLLLAGLREREVETRVLPNGGIRRSVRISTGLAVVGFALTAMGMGTFYGPFYGACAGLTSAAALWLWYGGLATIEHGVLRLLLRWSHIEYCDVAFLDAAANRGLLHRVGGGYMFVHPTLMERLVARSEEAALRKRQIESSQIRC